MSATTEVIDPHEHAQDSEVAAHGGHPSDWTYVKVAIFLAVMTGIEVALFYNPVGGSKNPVPNNVVLLALAGVKFVTVALFFMHLKYDNRILGRLFAAGFGLAAFCYIVVMLMFGTLSFPFKLF